MAEKTAVQPYPIKRTIVAIVVVLLIAAVHVFRVGAHFSGTLFVLYYSFFSDIVIPVAIYFLLCINDATIPGLRDWRIKAAIVFAAAAAAEVAQAFGLPLLGQTFDPLDFVMFGAGTLLAVGLDWLFSKLFSFWSFGDQATPSAA